VLRACSLKTVQNPIGSISIIRSLARRGSSRDFQRLLVGFRARLLRRFSLIGVIVSALAIGRLAAAEANFCRDSLSRADAILSSDVYAYYGEAISSETGSDAEKRIYEKSADFKAKRAELKALAAQFQACRFEFELPLSELSGGGESGSEAVSRIRGFYLFAGVINEYDIVRNRYQNSRGVVSLEFGETGSAALKRVDHLEPGLVVRLNGLKTTMIGDLPQLKVGFGNAGKHYFELGGLSDEQLVALERALSGGAGGYSLHLSFSIVPKLYRWVYNSNPVVGDEFHWALDTMKLEIRLTDSSGKTLKTWR
jgi:hypothetical protein